MDSVVEQQIAWLEEAIASATTLLRLMEEGRVSTRSKIGGDPWEDTTAKDIESTKGNIAVWSQELEELRDRLRSA